MLAQLLLIPCYSVGTCLSFSCSQYNFANFVSFLAQIAAKMKVTSADTQIPDTPTDINELGGSLANIHLPGNCNSYLPCGHPPGVECQPCKPECTIELIEDDIRCTRPEHCHCLARGSRCDVFCNCSSRCMLASPTGCNFHVLAYSAIARFGLHPTHILARQANKSPSFH